MNIILSNIKRMSFIIAFTLLTSHTAVSALCYQIDDMLPVDGVADRVPLQANPVTQENIPDIAEIEAAIQALIDTLEQSVLTQREQNREEEEDLSNNYLENVFSGLSSATNSVLDFFHIRLILDYTLALYED